MGMETELLSLIEYIDLGFAWIGPDYRVLWNNTKMGRFCEKGVTDLTGRHCHELFWGQEGACRDCPGKKAMATGTSVLTQLERDIEKDKKLQVRVHTFPTLAEDGSVTGFVKLVGQFSPLPREGAAQYTELNVALETKGAEGLATLPRSNPAGNNKVAEMKKMEAELKCQQQQHEKLSQLFNTVELGKKEWELILDCIKDVVVLVDGEGRIRRSNRALVELTGKGYPELIGQDIQKVFKEGRLPLDDLSRQRREVCHELSGRWYLMNSYRPGGLRDEGEPSSPSMITPA